MRGGEGTQRGGRNGTDTGKGHRNCSERKAKQERGDPEVFAMYQLNLIPTVPFLSSFFHGARPEPGSPLTSLPLSLSLFRCQVSSLCQQTRCRTRPPCSTTHAMPGPDPQPLLQSGLRAGKGRGWLAQLRESFHSQKATLAEPQVLHTARPRPCFDALMIPLSDQ